MDLRTLTKLILKLAGLYYLASSLIAAMGIVANPVPNAVPWYVATYSMYLLLGAALFWLPGTIVSHVLRIKGAELEGALTASKLLEVGLALLGAYFFVAGAYACI